MKKSLSNGTTVQTLLKSYEAAFKAAAPKHLNIERLMRIVLTDVSRNKKLLECTAGSLFASVMTSVQLGLEIGVLGQAYLVPYKNKRGVVEAQLIPGYRGLVQLARNSGVISSIYANVVYEQDKIRYVDGFERILEHDPVPLNQHFEEKDEDIIAAYAVCHFKDGTKHTEVMRRSRIDKIRRRSKSSNEGPWVTDFAEMAKKTVLRRLCKLLPVSIEMSVAVNLDERAAMGVPQNIQLTELEHNKYEIDVPVDETDEPGQTEEPAADGKPVHGTLDPSRFKEATGRANRGHGRENLETLQQQQLKTKTEAEQVALEQQLEASLAATRCDVEDFLRIEAAANDGNVRMDSVVEHVQATMGFEKYGDLTKARLPEVFAWIRAKDHQ